MTFLATADGSTGASGGRAGWAALCRLVSATHLAGRARRCRSSTSPSLADQLGEQLAAGHLMVLLGPASELARAALCPYGGRRDDLALAALEPWRALVPRTHLQVELVSHRLPGSARERLGSRHRPARRPDGADRPAGRARHGAHQRGPLRRPPRRPHRRRPRRRPPAGRPRPAPRRPRQRRGVPQVRQADGRGRRGDRPARRAGADSDREAQRLLAHTRAVADRCALDPRRDLGLGEVHFPEFELADPRRRSADDRRAPPRPTGCCGRAARARSATATARPHGSGLEAARRRARGDPRARLRVVLPHRRRRHRPDPRDGGALRGPRLGRGQPGQLPARGLRRRPDAPRAADGAVPLAAARGAARHRRRRGVGAPARGLRARSSTATAASAASASR